MLSYEEIKSMYITGLQVAYYIVCKRKLWLFSNDITFEHTSELVELGKILEEKFFKDTQNLDEFFYEPIKVDFITLDDGIVVHEVKRTKSLQEAHVWQVKYYIWYLRNKGIDALYGVIHYPRSMNRTKVDLQDSDNKLIEEALKSIRKILSMPKPPRVERKPYCKKCAYFYFCYG